MSWTSLFVPRNLSAIIAASFVLGSSLALLRDDGILLMFNATKWASRGLWTLGQALIDRHDLTTVLLTGS